MTANDSSLLPCPFCGGSGAIGRDYDMDDLGIFLFVKCSKCGAASTKQYHSKGNDCPQTYAEVRQAWNTRAGAAYQAAQPVQVSEWQDISTAPKDGTLIDVLLNGDARVPEVYWCIDDKRFIDTLGTPVVLDCDPFNQITHWMPIPMTYKAYQAAINGKDA